MENWKSNEYLYNRLTDFMLENDIKYGCNITKLCKRKGWKLTPYPFEHYLEYNQISTDGFSVYEDNDFYIFYNPFQKETRLNFTIAHEVAHIVLLHHVLMNKRILSKNHRRSITEHQADIFAHNILMPPGITREQSQIKSVYELSEQFEVSPTMVQTRLRKLDNDIRWFSYVFKERSDKW